MSFDHIHSPFLKFSQIHNPFRAYSILYHFFFFLPLVFIRSKLYSPKTPLKHSCLVSGTLLELNDPSIPTARGGSSYLTYHWCWHLACLGLVRLVLAVITSLIHLSIQLYPETLFSCSHLPPLTLTLLLPPLPQ